MSKGDRIRRKRRRMAEARRQPRIIEQKKTHRAVAMAVRGDPGRPLITMRPAKDFTRRRT